MQAIEILMELNNIKQRIESLKKEYNNLEEHILSLNAIDYSSDKVDGGMPPDLANKIVQLLSFQEEIKEEIVKYDALYIQAMRAIHAIPNHSMAKLLILRYAEGRPWKEVSAAMNMSESYCRGTFHSMALRQFKKYGDKLQYLQQF